MGLIHTAAILFCFTTLDLTVKNLGVRLDRQKKATLVSRDLMAAMWQRPITMYSWLLMTQILADSNLTLTLTKIDFPLDYLYTFSVILPYVTRTMFLISMWQVEKESVLQSETLNIFQITVIFFVFAFCQCSLNTVSSPVY